MSAYPRWLIRGTFTTTAPLHVGSGDVIDHPRVVNAEGNAVQVAAVVRDYQGRPCVPGTAIKGVLRAWAERFFRGEARTVERIFGIRDSDADEAEAGWAEFLTATLATSPARGPEPPHAHVPDWRGERGTGILSHVAINRRTGAAEPAKLFYEEFVPEPATFDVRIAASRLDAGELALLLAVLDQGWQHPTHPYQLGANGGDGWGRVRWSLSGVSRWEPRTGDSLAEDAVGFACCTASALLGEQRVPNAELAPAHVALGLTLKFDGPLLVNDASRAKTPAMSEADQQTHTNFTPLRRQDGGVWLPSSTLRGVLRQRAEFLLRSLDPSAAGDPNVQPVGDGPIRRLFGDTGRASRLTIVEPKQVGPYVQRRQDFVAIDRFTGGAADGGKFDATYADRPEVRTTLTLDLAGLERQDLALLLRALRDLCKGEAAFGFGGSKGYGQAAGTVAWVAAADPERTWDLPATPFSLSTDDGWSTWLNGALAGLPTAAPYVAPPVAQAATAPAASGRATAAEELKVGRLVRTMVGKTIRPVLEATTTKGEPTKYTQINDQMLSRELRRDPALAIPVHYVLGKSGPTRIRHFDKPWDDNPPGATSERFIHPYYFLPLDDRAQFQADTHQDLADRKPGDQHVRWLPGCFSGTLRVRLTTQTPLLLCDDAPAVDGNGHKTYAVRKQDGKPLLAPSSVRGMLRAAYEAITNSRFGVFPGKLPAAGAPARQHGRPLEFRPPPTRDRNGKFRISPRRPYAKSPLELLPTGLRPATSESELSPADRVFGWVGQDQAKDDKAPAYRGLIRVGPATCVSDDPIEKFEPRRTLAILAQPKPQQGRFYVGGANGFAQPAGLDKEAAGYTPPNRIRGPKVYPHHRDSSEGRETGAEPSDQNRSIEGWVKEGKAFVLDLHVKNLTGVELGALVWLLSLPDGHFLRLGLGKPLGFGSVRAEILETGTRITDGAAWAASLASWDAAPPDSLPLAGPKRQFEQLIASVNPKLLPSFLRAAEGFANLPVRYPQLSTQTPSEGEHYRWFVQNERNQRATLPELLDPKPSLPANP